MKPTRLRIVQNDDQLSDGEPPQIGLPLRLISWRGVKKPATGLRGFVIVSYGGSILPEMPVMIKEGRKAQRRKTAR